MTKRRTHSSVDKLPRDLREAIVAMLVDNEWPKDFPRQKALGFKAGDRELTGKPRYEDCVTYCEFKGHDISPSAMGRFGMQMRMLARMKNAGVVVRDVMKDLNAEKASETQKAVAEMITATTIEFISSRDDLDAKQIRDIAKAIKDCTAVSISADKYIRDQITKKVEKATASTKKKLGKAGVDRKLIQEIIDEHLGVVKS